MSALLLFLVLEEEGLFVCMSVFHEYGENVNGIKYVCITQTF